MKILKRCMALDDNGDRCPRTDRLLKMKYHGSNELYGYYERYPTWVEILLCPDHRREKNT